MSVKSEKETYKTEFQCKICGERILFDTTDDSTFLSKTEHESFFGMQLFSYRVAHMVNGEKHINTLLVDHKGLFRGYVDAFTEQIVQLEDGEKQNIDDYVFLGEDLPPVMDDPNFDVFLFFDTREMWILQIAKTKRLNMKNVFSLLYDKVQEIKQVYNQAQIPKPLEVSVADLKFHVWVDNSKMIAIAIGDNNELDLELLNQLIQKILTYYKETVVLPRKRAFVLLPKIFSKTKVSKADIPKMMNLLTNNLLYTEIKTRYEDMIPRIIEMSSKRYPIAIDILPPLFNGKYSVIDLLEKKSEYVLRYKEIIDLINFINRRKLLA